MSEEDGIPPRLDKFYKDMADLQEDLQDDSPEGLRKWYLEIDDVHFSAVASSEKQARQIIARRLSQKILDGGFEVKKGYDVRDVIEDQRRHVQDFYAERRHTVHMPLEAVISRSIAKVAQRELDAPPARNPLLDAMKGSSWGTG